MPARPIRIVKVGGSLVADPPRLKALLREVAENRHHACAIVPGGGAFADAVRRTQDALGFDDRLAHRLALDAISATAQVFRPLEPRLRLVESVRAAETSLRQGHAAIWAPRDIRDGHPDIPESWDVTSDSLALWLAARLGAESCILVKSADPPEQADPDALARCGLVDRAFPGFAGRFTGPIVLEGPTRALTLIRSTDREAAA